MKFSQGLGVILGTTTLALVQYQPVSALTPVEVNDIAKPITVMIGGLDGKGSGVIIDKNGNTYTVLTANHVVEKAGYGLYEIITHDGQKYPMENKAQTLGKLDLALVRFTSSKNYPIAKIADSRTVKEGETVHNSGFPIPSISNNQQRNYFFITAQITSRGRGENLGYDLFLSGNMKSYIITESQLGNIAYRFVLDKLNNMEFKFKKYKEFSFFPKDVNRADHGIEADWVKGEGFDILVGNHLWRTVQDMFGLTDEQVKDAFRKAFVQKGITKISEITSLDFSQFEDMLVNNVF